MALPQHEPRVHVCASFRLQRGCRGKDGGRQRHRDPGHHCRGRGGASTQGWTTTSRASRPSSCCSMVRCGSGRPASPHAAVHACSHTPRATCVVPCGTERCFSTAHNTMLHMCIVHCRQHSENKGQDAWYSFFVDLLQPLSGLLPLLFMELYTGDGGDCSLMHEQDSSSSVGECSRCR